VKRKRNAKQRKRRPDDTPDTTGWRPRADASESLSIAFLNRCQAGEQHLLHMLARERASAIDAYDSGKPFELAVREEVARLIPLRYAVTDGVLVDRNGASAGHADLVVFNQLWFTPVNAPMVSTPARTLIPIEGAYAVGEVKQRLTRATLEEAMEKLVSCQRLERPRTFANRLVENREADSCTHGLTNPLFTFIIAAEVDEDAFQGLINHFFDINSTLKRLEVVRCLCVLGAGAVGWAFRDPLHDFEIKPALFMRDDLFHPVVPAFSSAAVVPPLFSLLQLLHLHLFHSILGPEDIATAYGFKLPSGVAIPKEPRIALHADEEWRESLRKPCKDKTHRH
jgi:hypothetical protein